MARRKVWGDTGPLKALRDTRGDTGPLLDCRGSAARQGDTMTLGDMIASVSPFSVSRRGRLYSLCERPHRGVAGADTDASCCGWAGGSSVSILN